MTTREYTDWVCDRCGRKRVVEHRHGPKTPDDINTVGWQPRNWTRVTMTSPPRAEINNMTEDPVLCEECSRNLTDFLHPANLNDG